MNPRNFLIAFLFLSLPSLVQAVGKKDSIFQERLQQSITIYDSLRTSSGDGARDSIGERFDRSMKKLLETEGIFQQKFPELGERIAILYAPDSSFRLFNWNVAHQNGTHDYYAYLLRKTRDGRTRIHQPEKVLSSSDRNKKSGSSIRKEQLERMDLEPGEWIPSLYYRIIRKERNGKPFYTLLGWEGKDQLTTRKTIEVLRFEDDGAPHFGFPVFKEGGEKDEQQTWKDRDRRRRKRVRGKGKNQGQNPKERIIFEYTDDAIMTLQYEKEKDRIVFNQLVPERPDLEGMYEFYAPDLLFNAYEWKEAGYWQMKEKVEPENETRKGRNWNDPEE